MQLLFSLAAFRRQDVPREGVATYDFARARLLKTLGRTFVGLQFRHKNCSIGGAAEIEIIARAAPRYTMVST